MTDIATLGIRVDSRNVRRAESDLDSFGREAESTVSKVGKLAAAFAGMVASAGVVNKLIEVEREFGILSSSLVTATGNANDAADAFDLLEDLASQLPSSLPEVTDAFIKMRNLGLDPSEKAIKSYANTAAAMGKGLNQMVEAVADAATGEFERLKEFGIKSSKQGDEVAFTFQGTTKVIKNSSDEIVKYLQRLGNVEFAGAATARMKTMDGAIINLEDSWDSLFEAVNAAGAADVIESSIRLATEALNAFNDLINSGELVARVEAIGHKFQRLGDDIFGTFDLAGSVSKETLDSIQEHFGNAVEWISDTFSNLPENITTVTRLMATTIAAFVTRVEIEFDYFTTIINPTNWVTEEQLLKFRNSIVGTFVEMVDKILSILPDWFPGIESARDTVKAALNNIALEYTKIAASVDGLAVAEAKRDAAIKANNTSELQAYSDILAKRDDLIQATEDEEDAITDNSRAYFEAEKARRAAAKALRDYKIESEESTEATEDLGEAVEDFNYSLEDLEDTIEDIDFKAPLTEFSEIFEESMKGNLDSFDEFGDRLLKSFGQTMATMAEQAHKGGKDVQGGLMTALSVGASGGGFGMAAGAGLGAILGAGNPIFTAIGATAGGLVDDILKSKPSDKTQGYTLNLQTGASSESSKGLGRGTKFSQENLDAAQIGIDAISEFSEFFRNEVGEIGKWANEIDFLVGGESGFSAVFSQVTGTVYGLGDNFERAVAYVNKKIAESALQSPELVDRIGEISKTGELWSDTLVRIFDQMNQVNNITSTLGMSFEQMGIDGAILTDQLVTAVGSMQEFAAQTRFFYDNFFTSGEKFTQLSGDINTAFEELGVSIPESREEFKKLVQGLDLTDEAGQQLFAGLMDLAPAMDSFYTQTDNYTTSITQLFNEILGREPRAEGVEHYLTALENGSLTMEQIANEINNSFEKTSQIAVNEIFQEILGRDALKEGLDYYVGQLQEGSATLASIRKEIIFNTTKTVEAVGTLDDAIEEVAVVANEEAKDLIETEQGLAEERVGIVDNSAEDLLEVERALAEQRLRDAEDLADLIADYSESLQTMGMSDYERALFELNKEISSAIDEAKGLGATEQELTTIRRYESAQRAVIEEEESDRIKAAADDASRIKKEERDELRRIREEAAAEAIRIEEEAASRILAARQSMSEFIAGGNTDAIANQVKTLQGNLMNVLNQFQGFQGFGNLIDFQEGTIRGGFDQTAEELVDRLALNDQVAAYNEVMNSFNSDIDDSQQFIVDVTRRLQDSIARFGADAGPGTWVEHYQEMLTTAQADLESLEAGKIEALDALKDIEPFKGQAEKLLGEGSDFAEIMSSYQDQLKAIFEIPLANLLEPFKEGIIESGLSPLEIDLRRLGQTVDRAIESAKEYQATEEDLATIRQWGAIEDARIRESYVESIEETGAAIEEVTETIEEMVARLTNEAQTALGRLKASVEAEKGDASAIYEDNVKALKDNSEILIEGIRANANAEISVIKSEYDAMVKAAKAQYDSIADSIKAQIGLTSDAISQLSGFVKDVDRAISSANAETDKFDRLHRQQAQARLREALATGDLSGDDLSGALKKVSEPSAKLFRSFEEYMHDFNVTNALLSDLKREGEGQLTVEEQTLEALKDSLEQAKIDRDLQLEQAKIDRDLQLVAAETNRDLLIASATANLEIALAHEQAIFDAEMERLDAIFENAQQQLDALLGIDNSILSLNSALSNFAGAMASLQAAQVESMRTTTVTPPPPIRRYASGGSHEGGLRIVGEQGPELEFTGPSRIESHAKSKQLLDNSDVVEAVQDLKKSIEVNAAWIRANGKKTKQIIDRWDYDGLPAERT